MSDSANEVRVPKVALVGHPNVGKTTLFNQLTGENRKVGNYPGVTVTRTSATFFTPHGNEIIDGDTYRREQDDSPFRSISNLFRALTSQ